MTLLPALALAALCAIFAPARAAEFRGTPGDYRAIAARLAPGDTLRLEAGVYREGLVLHDVHGVADAPIVIAGPREGAPAVFLAREGANTISLAGAGYITLADLTLDGSGLDADAVKAEGGRSAPVHDITLLRLVIVGHDRAQDSVAISTKTPAWRWVIRECVIAGAGTGMYFGDSDGTAPFIAGVIEDNVIVDTIGYNIEIKHQRARPALASAPEHASETVIRRNVFAKSARASTGDAARPNLLLGHFPPVGAGSEDAYSVAGNLFFDNPSEALMQAEGNVAITRNVFFNPHGDALVVQPHRGTVRRARIERNDIVAQGAGVRLHDVPKPPAFALSGNVIRAAVPVDGASASGNDVGRFDDAAASPLRALMAWREAGGDVARLRTALAPLCVPAGAPAATLRTGICALSANGAGVTK